MIHTVISTLLPKEANSPRYVVLAESLLKRISAGSYAVGSKLPNEKELAKEFDVAVMTVRQGVGLLVRKGVVERRQGKGTFVKSVSTSIGIIFGPDIANETAHYYRALLRELENLTFERRWGSRYYDRLNPAVAAEGISERQRNAMQQDHGNHAYSGLIEIAPPSTTLIAQQLFPYLPRASMAYAMPNCDITVDTHHFGHESVCRLAAMGCKKPFYFQTLWSWETMTPIVDGMLDGAKECGLPAPVVHSEYLISQGYESEKALFESFRKLLAFWKTRKGAAQRPDGIIFNDDIVLRAVAPALMEAQLSIPTNLKVLTLSNEGVRFHYGFPVIRYQLSPRSIAETLLSILTRRMQDSQVSIAPLLHQGSIVVDE